MNELALFAGAGGGILGGKLLGWRTVCAVEEDEFARAVLASRQNDGTLEPFPIWDDVRSFDGHPWRGCVDVVSGGFPCQDISKAGTGDGLDGDKSGLWTEFARIIREVRPRNALVENAAVLTARGLGRVLGDLAALGYDAQWGVLGAADAIWLDGAPCFDHERERIWIIATDSGAARDVRHREAEEQFAGRGAAARDTYGPGQQMQWQPVAARSELQSVERGNWWKTEPRVGRVADGLAARVDRLHAIGNGQVPAVVRLAWRILGGGA